jgi:hypothetical protein
MFMDKIHTQHWGAREAWSSRHRLILKWPGVFSVTRNKLMLEKRKINLLCTNILSKNKDQRNRNSQSRITNHRLGVLGQACNPSRIMV